MSEIPALGSGLIASMGIYLFKREALEGALKDPSFVDFGRHLIPEILPRLRVQAHVHRGYWEDVGTIRSYYHANLALCQAVPPFDFYDASRPVYTHPRFLPASKIESCTVTSSLLSEGCILVGAQIERSVVGIRSRIGRGAQLRDSLILGADYYETLDELERHTGRGAPPVGVGADAVVHLVVDTDRIRAAGGGRPEHGHRAPVGSPRQREGVHRVRPRARVMLDLSAPDTHRHELGAHVAHDGR